MNYETHDFTQGSPEWHAHRDGCYNASDLAAAAGESPYKKRDTLIREIATGEVEVIDQATQKRFDDGHRFEALARPLAEELIGEDLFPSVLSASVEGLSRRLGVSLDGKTMGDDVNWEHKTLSSSLAASLDQDIIPDFYHWQLEAGMLINGASKCLFSASRWDENDQLIDIKHVWYASNPELRARIIPTWKQLEQDVANYKHVEVIPAAVATPTLDLPVVSIQTSGSIAIRSNLRAFGEALNTFISRLPTKPSTDQEFADCKAALTKLKTAEETLDSEEAKALAQMEEIDEMRREKKLYQELARTTRLALEKLVTAREAAIKSEIVQEGKDKLAEHIAMLNKRLGRVHMPAIPADFVGAIKNKRTVESLRNAVDTALANAKIAANEIADKIQINLSALDEHKEFDFLFSDVATLAMKANDDLKNIIKLRINEHQAEQQRKLDAERERIRKEEQERADREAADRLRQQEVEKKTEAPTVSEVEQEVIPSPSVASSVVAQSATVHGKAKPTMTSAGMSDYENNIIAMISGMDESELKLVAHYCERIIAQRKEAA